MMQAMRFRLSLAVALLALPVGARAADSEGGRVDALEARMRVLEDKLAASEATIDAQRELLQRAAPDVAQGSAIDAFFSKLEVGGFVTGSYLYNFNQPARGAVIGGTPGLPPFTTQPLNQFNRRHDEFSLDAVKLEVGKAAANPGEAGFQIDLLYGQNADILRSFSPTNPAPFGDSDESVFVQEAYAAYNMNGVTWKLGKFETLLGYEVIDSYRNPNVTHGLLFTWAIPLYHTGVLASGPLGEGVTWALGLTDGFNNVIENNDGKGILGQIAATSGPFSGSFNVFWGGEGSEGSDSSSPNAGGAGMLPSTSDLMIFDAIGSYSPSDTMTFWVNADLGKQEDQWLASNNTVGVPFQEDDPYYWGVALGGKFKLTEKLGFAVRGEYFDDEDDMRGTSFGITGSTPGVKGADVELYSLTGTLSYAFTSNLLMRGEVRYDHADNSVPGTASAFGDGEIFPKGGDANTENESILGLVEVSYIFD
jgi:hypothetical protein